MRSTSRGSNASSWSARIGTSSAASVRVRGHVDVVRERSTRRDADVVD
jgi:hypothetical protein